MKKHRIYINRNSIHRNRYIIKDSGLAKYLRSVLRLEKGSDVILFDGKGTEYEASIGFLSKDTVSGVISSQREIPFPDKPYLILAQSLPRAGKLDSIIRMNTEAGVREFVLFESEYSIVPAGNIKPEKITHLMKIAEEAVRQSENSYLPEITGPVSFEKLIKAKIEVEKIILHSRKIKNAVNLKEWAKTRTNNNTKAIIAIGPEGGFSADEIKTARANGWGTAYLDLPILRSETAGIAASAILLS